MSGSTDAEFAAGVLAGAPKSIADLPESAKAELAARIGQARARRVAQLRAARLSALELLPPFLRGPVRRLFDSAGSPPSARTETPRES
ncbi:hypothetical protein IU433_06505 [Nocardia puris]|uniref:Uncharacterized protein n=1 Tax=Nocardia puris TaxID=208602 RepID=A0A366DCN2_9NOCA|nr:hypothetical protein [Nocardia puris]MBF6211185.1 hypothetical protein [Nocardia puris]MBF6364904.1 hypothetical protein [Nocardia puris]MBF6458690.1 hypothetical protein [Nocardia puris]RBO87811.1 hypothetical protein DFR74_11065 [Nocardia puris]